MPPRHIAHLRRRRRGFTLVAPAAVASLLVTGTLWASPVAATSATAIAPVATTQPLSSYDEEIVDQFDAGNSVDHIRELVVGIGPRLTGTPQEGQGAEYIGEVLESYGFTVEYQKWGPVSTKRVAAVTSPNATLPGGPNWQMSASAQARMTGDSAPVSGTVLDVGAGLDAAAFASAAGKVVLANNPSVASSRTTIMNNALASGAAAVIFVPATGTGAPPTISFSGVSYDIPVLGGGAAHGAWMRGLLAQGPLTLRIATNTYESPMGTNVIGIRPAVGDPAGTTAPIVMIGAHIDSVLGSPGAHDDASGNGVSLEFARVLSQYPLDKELRIGGFGGEESGLLGARAYASTLTAAEKARFVGEWQMDMVGTPYAPAGLFALTPDGRSNLVVQSAYDAVARQNHAVNLQNCKLGQSDHQAFYDVGIPSALFIWLDYRMPADCVTGRASYVTEPEYHRPTDTMDNISQPRLQTTLDVVGGSAAYHALNAVTIAATGTDGAPLAGADVRADCGDGWRPVGTTGADGRVEAVYPHATCTFEAVSGSALVQQTTDVHGDLTVDMTVALPECTSTVTGRSGKVHVTSGVTCLVGASVSGGVTVAKGASLVSFDSTVKGGITAVGAADVVVCEGSVTGGLTVTDSARVRVGGERDCGGVSVTGGITVSGTTDLLIVAGNSVTGGIDLTANHGAVPILVTDNSVRGKLSCSDNVPGMTDAGTPNGASGALTGQCDLAA